MTINASDYVGGGGGSISQVRYDGSVAAYNVNNNHLLNPRTKYVVVDIVGGGGGGQGGFDASAYYSRWYQRYAGFGGGAGGSIFGLVYYIPDGTTSLSFTAGKGGLGSTRGNPSGNGEGSYFAGVASGAGGKGFDLNQTQFMAWIALVGDSVSRDATDENGWGKFFKRRNPEYDAPYSHVQSEGGKVSLQLSDLTRQPSSINIHAMGGNGGNGGVYLTPPSSGLSAGNHLNGGYAGLIENIEPFQFIQTSRHIYNTPDGGYVYKPPAGGHSGTVGFGGGGGGSSLRARGGHGQYIGQNSNDYQIGRLGSGGGGGAIAYYTNSGVGDDQSLVTAPGKDGGAGYVWIREFG